MPEGGAGCVVIADYGFTRSGTRGEVRRDSPSQYGGEWLGDGGVLAELGVFRKLSP